jgi:hypothetical protein
MLTEISCDEFKSNNRTRPPIVFSAGLNTVLGDQVGSNSIGKTTFLMIVDFVFGGNDYVEKSTDVQKQIGEHTIKFTFRFNDQNHYFSRDTVTHNHVNECDSKYNVLSEMSIEDFRKFLFDKYEIALPFVSFRDIVTRYFRVYGRDNLNEKHPLQAVSKETDENAIASLMKLFNAYKNVASLREELEKEKEKYNVYKKSIKHGFMPSITKRQQTINERQIRELKNQLGEISRQPFFQNIEIDDAEQIALVKSELTSLRRQRSRFESKLALIRKNLDNSNAEFQNDFSELQKFFPFVDIRSIYDIETFHRKLQSILKSEFLEEQRRTDVLLRKIISDISDNEKHFVPLKLTNKRGKQIEKFIPHH